MSLMIIMIKHVSANNACSQLGITFLRGLHPLHLMGGGIPLDPALNEALWQRPAYYENRFPLSERHSLPLFISVKLAMSTSY